MVMISVTNGHYERDGFSLDIDFAVKRKSVTAVIGPSGAGKSTLLNIIGGFDQLRHGEILLDAETHTQTAPSARPVNFVFQDNNCFAHMTARNNVALGIAPSLSLSTDDWHKIDHALEEVGIGHLAHRKPGDMSGGERQRIALARVLVRHKPILLLDEAFAALGPALRKDMLLLVQNIQAERELTVLMVTHEPSDAKLIADQVIFIANDFVRPPQSTAKFFASRDALIRDYLGKRLPA
jgi:thiamine transport system ATP-binding protein